jgi:predicted nucleotidyltransferase component of viral defense system
MTSPRLYPISIAEIEPWRRAHGTTVTEATDRFFQFLVLESIASSELREHLYFKGGNALRFIYGNPRSTLDLDFSADHAVPDDEIMLRDILDRAVRRTFVRHGAKGKVQSVRRNPHRPESTLPTYSAKIGYQLPGDRHFADFETTSVAVSKVVRVEISINDVVCDSDEASLGPRSPNRIVVCTRNDIIAEKLRSILQQRIRNRNRKQDAYDISRMMREHGDKLDHRLISLYLQHKSEARHIEAKKRLFDKDLRARAKYGYEELQASTGEAYIPFDDAWADVMSLVRSLAIPD